MTAAAENAQEGDEFAEARGVDKDLERAVVRMVGGIAVVLPCMLWVAACVDDYNNS